MDIDTLTTSVTQHNDKFFAPSLEIIDENFNFIDTHNLLEPKENYLLIIKYLNLTINHFSNLDQIFASETLKKLHRDINNLYKLYESHKAKMEDMGTLFQAKFLSKVPLLNKIKQNLLDLKKSATIDDKNLQAIKIVSSQYKELTTVYFDVFKEDFLDQNNYILTSLENILNTKVYYLDTLLWMDVLKSNSIIRSLKMAKINENINSKKYLTYRLSVALPYTDDYKYLQKCLRIYQ